MQISPIIYVFLFRDRWSKDWGLSDMGFGREKTTYCYFAIASSCSLPYDSDIRMMVAKSAILITVADDFFDMEGSLIQLKDLTDAVQRHVAI
jgi:geranyllinalool synthase